MIVPKVLMTEEINLESVHTPATGVQGYNFGNF